MKSDFGIIYEANRQDCKVLEIDTKKASYQGRPWRSLGDWGKRKFETLLILNKTKSRLKILYV